MHKLTNLGKTQMFVDFIYKGQFKQNQYNYFNIGNEVQSYVVNTSDTDMNGMKFTTNDRDNDLSSGVNCAKLYKAGWWYSKCYSWRLVGNFSNTSYAQGVCFESLSYFESISYGVMKIRRRELF
jgi:hypothetical protein